ncbi:MAG: DNA polymerase III subunit gamma/tau [Oscillospiraceae bacterium]|jgi:DNA polymerase-3 subunit gamma/tau|nr:DNA polymerase III subunit gamma/tau [Oscillospiraceae bacterium]
MYQVLYRKWRSPTFSDVIGQEHVTSTLRRALATGRLAHAYLFTGPRGTGKTSCARILAKAVNCLHPVEGEPCNECELCRDIDSGNVLDVIEIDAASNNGVDNIRDLREETNFTPSRGAFRVYIIDEVHMLSAGAFNALLKTLEEPPSYVIFILATTEVHKLPATVLSRCQRFDFHRISMEDIANRLLYVAEKESFVLEPAAAMLLARVADGAMRDALSLLDRCRVEGEAMTAESVARCIGMADRHYLFELTDAALSGHIAACLELIQKLYQDACDMERLCEELLGHLRNLLIMRTVKAPKEFLVVTDEDFQLYQAQAEKFSTMQLLRWMELLETTAGQLRRSADRRMEMELGLIRLCTQEAGIRRQETGSSVAQEAGIRRQETGSAVAQEAGIRKQETGNTIVQDGKQETESAAIQEAGNATAPSPLSSRLFAEWGEVLQRLQGSNRALAGILAGSSAVARGDFILIKSDNPAFPAFIKQSAHANALKEVIYQLTDRNVRLGIFKPQEEAATSAAADPLAKLQENYQNLI